MTLNDTASNRAKAQLDQLGWSINGTAKKIGISTGHLNRLLSGDARWNTDMLEKVSAVLGVTPAWLMGASARDAGARASPVDPGPLIEAVQRGDPAAIGRAFVTMIGQVPAAPNGNGDPVRAELIQAYDRRDWRTLMILSGRLSDQWDR